MKQSVRKLEEIEVLCRDLNGAIQGATSIRCMLHCIIVVG